MTTYKVVKPGRILAGKMLEVGKEVKLQPDSAIVVAALRAGQFEEMGAKPTAEQSAPAKKQGK